MNAPQAMNDLRSSQKGWVRIKFDQLTWIPILPLFPEGYDLRSYCAEYAQAWWDASGLPHTATDVQRLFHLLIAAHEGTYGHIPCHLAFAHLPDPRLLPLLLYVGVWEAVGERDERLRMLCLIEDPQAVERPIVEDFATDSLGTGLRVMRYRHHDDGALYAALRYAWRSEELQTDLVLNATGEDLGRLQRAIPDIEELARATTIIPDRLA